MESPGGRWSVLGHLMMHDCREIPQIDQLATSSTCLSNGVED
jgi:hypothetical protein